MTDDFAYVNARIRGMRSELLSGAMMRELSSLGDLDGIMARLRSTAYGRPLQSSLRGIPGSMESKRDSATVSVKHFLDWGGTAPALPAGSSGSPWGAGR